MHKLFGMDMMIL